MLLLDRWWDLLLGIGSGSHLLGLDVWPGLYLHLVGWNHLVVATLDTLTLDHLLLLHWSDLSLPRLLPPLILNHPTWTAASLLLHLPLLLKFHELLLGEFGLGLDVDRLVGDDLLAVVLIVYQEAGLRPDQVHPSSDLGILTDEDL